MSKSQLRTRFSYWLASTIRIETSTPTLSSTGFQKLTTRSKAGALISTSTVIFSPVLRIGQLVILDLLAGFAEQSQSLAQIVAHRIGIAAHRIGEGRGEDLGRHLVLHGVEDFEFESLRQTRRSKFGAFENSSRCACTGRRISACSFPRKSKAKLKARRTRASLNLSRRILKAKACITPKLRISNSSSTTRLCVTAGKS